MSRKENPVDFVLDRMVEAVMGENAHFKSHADALGVPTETIKSWRRRREVPPGRLADFARDWKVSVDWLLHGVRPADPAPSQLSQKVAGYSDLAADERKLIENYRAIPNEVREALQLVASIASRPHAGVSAVAKVRVPRHGGSVEPVSRHGTAVSEKKPGRQRGPGQGNDAQ